MAAVFRETNVDWNGVTYRVIPSNKLLRRIESEGISLMHMVQEAQKGKVQISLLAFVLATVLQSAGAAITEEDMLCELSDPAAQGRITPLTQAILAAIFPQADHDPRKPAAPEKRRRG